MSFKSWERYSSESLVLGQQDLKGRLFMSSLGQRNLAKVNLLHEGVDTIRQLYEGVLRSDVLERIKQIYELGPARRLINVLGRDWLLGSGNSSGFRYRLQDNDLGIILFISSRYAFETTKHSHLKIELSPHFIDSRSSSTIQSYLNVLASSVLETPSPAGCAVHLCVDVQGWKPPKDFADLLVTRARARSEHRGISSFDVSLSSFASIYGQSETFLFGKADGLQFTLYRKDLQIKVADKSHFWVPVWQRRTWEDFRPIYDADEPVWRFEFRFHQTVVKEFSESVQQPLLMFSDLVPHLTGLFRYALGNFRLNAVSSSAKSSASFYRGVYIDPMWQLLMQDIEILGPKADLNYKRKRKKPGQGGLRNLWLSVGNLTTIYARNGYTPVQAVKYLKSSGVWEDQLEYYRLKYKDLCDVCDDVLERFAVRQMEIKLTERRLLGVAA